MIGKVIYTLLNSLGHTVSPAKHDKTYPCITYNKIGRTSYYTNDGNSKMAREVWQISAWDDTYAGAEALKADIKNVIDSYGGTQSPLIIRTVFDLNENDLYEDDTEVYQNIIDFEFLFEEE